MNTNKYREVFIWGRLMMKDEKARREIPKELHKPMLEFFLKTSIPRIKKEREKNKSQIENKKR